MIQKIGMRIEIEKREINAVTSEYSKTKIKERKGKKYDKKCI